MYDAKPIKPSNGLVFVWPPRFSSEFIFQINAGSRVTLPTLIESIGSLFKFRLYSHHQPSFINYNYFHVCKGKICEFGSCILPRYKLASTNHNWFSSLFVYTDRYRSTRSTRYTACFWQRQRIEQLFNESKYSCCRGSKGNLTRYENDTRVRNAFWPSGDSTCVLSLSRIYFHQARGSFYFLSLFPLSFCFPTVKSG